MLRLSINWACENFQAVDESYAIPVTADVSVSEDHHKLLCVHQGHVQWSVLADVIS